MLLNIIWNDLTKKLIKMPAKSYWLYIGLKIFFIQTKIANDLCLLYKNFFSLKNKFNNPREYHQTGK